jgi:hypothetical protein
MEFVSKEDYGGEIRTENVRTCQRSDGHYRDPLIAQHRTTVPRRCHQPAHVRARAREQVRDSLRPYQSEISPLAVSSRSSPQRMLGLAVASWRPKWIQHPLI